MASAETPDPQLAERSLATAANLVTLARVPLALAFVFVYPLAAPGLQQGGLIACLTLLTLIELSDMTDGMVARGLSQVTDLGKLLDPACDAFTRSVVYFALACAPFDGGEPLLPLIVPAILVLRDTAVSLLRISAALQQVVVAARPSGKIKALVQGPAAIAILAVALWAPDRAPGLASILGWVVAGVTLVSLVDYGRANLPVLRRLV
ncbi:MAG: CDP-alcohol phosphatidyltransferase family protein [Planctomycetota bacterium]|jgi:CDP-diacylglycerol--glycerol-3-phosphate 3-phosphatidyltransferase